MQPLRLIVGLGNPGLQYAQTRHNVGQWLVGALAEEHHANWKVSTAFHSLTASIAPAKVTHWLSLPTTYMNLSGKAVSSIAQFYKIPPEQILIVHDDLDLPAGTIRLKKNGGDGGHNGLRSIAELLNSTEFYRLRIGIDRPEQKGDMSNYVLSKPDAEALVLIEEAISQALAHMPLILAGDMGKAMQHLHTDIPKC